MDLQKNTPHLVAVVSNRNIRDAISATIISSDSILLYCLWGLSNFELLPFSVHVGH